MPSPTPVPRPPRPTRRAFLRGAAGTLLAASVAPWSGCGRLLDWSAETSRGDTRSMAERRPDTTGTTAGPRSGSTAGTIGPSTDAPPLSVDLAVSRAPDPGRALDSALLALGGIERFVRSGDRVVIKPNVLTGRAPEYAVTTNPLLVGALARSCWQAGAREVVVLDRPTGSARTAFEVSGIAQAVAEADADVKYLSDRNYEKIAIPEGRYLTSWPLVTDVFEADVFINVPIAKTHGLAGLTMAMKNLMGIMGGNRGLIHVDFAQKIVDLNTLVRPHLVVLDATRILVRNGPTGGSLADVAKLDTVVVGTDQIAVDAYGATLFDVRPRDLGYLAAAEDRGLGSTDLGRLRIAEGVES